MTAFWSIRNFTLPRTYMLPADGPGEIAVIDVDSDGDLDLIFTAFRFDLGAPIHVSLNDGTGRFADRTSTFFPSGAPITVHPSENVIADFNGDHRLDVFIADIGVDSGIFPGHQNGLLLSDQTAGLVDATAHLPAVSDYTGTATAGDIDHDGDNEILILNAGGGTPISGSLTDPYFLIKDGHGNFTIISRQT